MAQVGKFFEFVELILFLKMYLQDGLVPSNQMVGSSFIPPGRHSRLGKGSEHSSNGFDKLKNLINSDITFNNIIQDQTTFWLKYVFLAFLSLCDPGTVITTLHFIRNHRHLSYIDSVLL